MADLCMCFPGGLHKAFTMSYDDGVEQDKQLIAIMEKYGLKGTFNLNSGLYAAEGYKALPGTIHRRMGKAEVSQVYARDFIEVATHCLTHPFLDRIPKPLAVKEVFEDRRNLEEQFDCLVQGHAYAFGAYSKDVEEILADSGILYARTVNATGRFDIPANWLELHPTCHHDDERLFDLADSFIKAKDNWGYPLMFYLWGHAYEFEANNNWDRIEKFAEIISGHEDIWYATNIQIVNYERAFRQLVFNADTTKVYNPTAIDIWFGYKEKVFCVKSGETLRF